MSETLSEAPSYRSEGRFLYATNLAGLDLGDDTFVIGQAIAFRLKALLGVGCSFNHWRYDNNVLFVLFFSSQLKKAEAWYGEWTLHDGKYLVWNPMYYGVIDREFNNDDEVMAFLKSPPPFSYSFDYLYSPAMMARVSDGEEKQGRS